MARYSDTLRDQNGIPIVGALIAVANQDGTTPSLTDDGGQALSNPLASGSHGSFYFNVENGFYDLKYYFGSRMIREDFGVNIGLASGLPAGTVVDALGSATNVAPSQRAVSAAVEGVITPLQFGTVTQGSDNRAPIMAALAYLKAKGGGTLRIPYIGGWQISDTITVDFSNCQIVLEDNISLTKTTAAAAIVFLGEFESPIENVSLVAPSKMTVDGNADAMTGYIYQFATTYYCAVLFKFCKNFVCRNIIAENGLTNSLRTFHSRYGLIENCEGNNTRYDNGISIDLMGPGFEINDRTTWTNIRVVGCSARGNQIFGGTSIAAIGVDWLECSLTGNGNNDGDVANPGGDVLAGPGGGMSCEFDPDPSGYRGNHYVTATNCKIEDNWSCAIWVTAAGFEMPSGYIGTSKIPTNYTVDYRPRGDGLFILASGAVTVGAGVTIADCARHGMYMLAAGGMFPSLTFSGTVDSAAERAIYTRGSAYVETTALANFTNCNGTNTSVVIFLNHSGGAGYNQDGGRASIKGHFSNNSGLLIDSDYVGEVSVEISGTGNSIGVGGGVGITVDHCALLTVPGVNLQNTTAEISICVVAGDNVGKAIIQNVNCPVTSSPVQNNATTRGGDMYLNLAGVAPDFAPSSHGDRVFDLNTGNLYIAGYTVDASGWARMAYDRIGNLQSLADLGSVADRLPYFTGVGTMSMIFFSAFARTLLVGGSAEDMQTTLDLVVGTDVQAHNALLDSIAGTTPAANGTYASPTSITITNGIITAIS